MDEGINNVAGEMDLYRIHFLGTVGESYICRYESHASSLSEIR